MNSRETILLATLELASEKGLGNISLSQIAEKVGIQKPSLYSHFSSKEELIESLYGYLREQAKRVNGLEDDDYGAMAAGRSAREVLREAVGNYLKLTTDRRMMQFYRFILSERAVNREAAKIMVAETERMLLATKRLFYAMQVHHVMDFEDADTAATAFAMAVHSLLDYQLDKTFVEGACATDLLDNFLDGFCAAYQRRETP